MAAFRRAKVESVEERAGLLHASVTADGDSFEAVAFPDMSGPLRPGDTVVVNTTGIELGLGTGGVAFVLWNLDAPDQAKTDPGHIMKLRYTPWQMNVTAVEAPESRHHDIMKTARTLDGMPVVCCGLHSQVAGVAAGVKAAAPDARVGYLMTDGGALPLRWSRLVTQLTDSGLLDVTCTAGHAFGGDLESVNVFSGLTALRHVGSADIVVVALGPGVVGTGTPLGFSGIEQGPNLDAAAALGGQGIACLRISFSDERERHRGVSHHSLTALGVAAREKTTVAVPKLAPAEARVVAEQLRTSGACDRHRMVTARGDQGVALLAANGIRVTTMGRTIEDAPHLFLAAAAAGRIAADMLAP